MPTRAEAPGSAQERLAARALLAAGATDERRFAQRKARSLPAYILSERLTVAVPCVVRDLSSTGAKLEIVLGRDTPISSAEGLPDRFVLYIMVDEVEMDCTIAWRRHRLAGVRFAGIARHRPRRAAGRRLRV